MSYKPGSSNSMKDVMLSDDDEPDEPSLLGGVQDVEGALASFREKWQKELKITKDPKSDEAASKGLLLEDCDQKAKNWYLKGDEMERSGKLYEAIQCYKRAEQLVPDIEFKIKQKDYAMFRRDETNNERNTDYINVENRHVRDEIHEKNANDDLSEGDLLLKIQKKMNRISGICTTEFDQRGMHISALPMEILLYIFKWVVSSELDMRSLEICSMVSRGFYLCARDKEIWRLACLRSWGMNCGNLANSYQSWRQMFLQRARLHFNGCYISKTTYIRHGENSFQDQFYRPWHLVAYFRYLRFFPDGLVLMLTTAEEPHQIVGLLKNRTVKQPSVLTGHYRIKDDKVAIVVQSQEIPRQNVFKRGRRWNDGLYECAEKSYHLELQIQNYNKRRNYQLAWSQYSIFIRNRNGSESKTSYEIPNNKFPPLWFSRVKSYTKESNNPLQ